ncbi:MAG: type II toxin-antitoxin system RelE/ParE family toxin, partial [Bacteroidetes bacterium]|nr:type II toxin-antitoxin system RelE/ParE family toxin [Bacteroidota bacterium]
MFSFKDNWNRKSISQQKTSTNRQMIEEFGPALDLPYTKAIGEGLFEIRAKGKEGIGRSFFCTVKGKEIIILHSFIKKSQKIPKKELATARKR